MEADHQWRFLENVASRRFASFGDVLDLAAEQRKLGTLRGRLGWSFDKLMIYGTGGFAYGSVEHRLSQTVVAPVVFSASRSYIDHGIKTGWTAGGGIEHAVSGSWSLGLQYLYTDVGAQRLTLPTQSIRNVSYPTSSAKFDDRSQEVTVRATYMLGK